MTFIRQKILQTLEPCLAAWSFWLPLTITVLHFLYCQAIYFNIFYGFRELEGIFGNCHHSTFNFFSLPKIVKYSYYSCSKCSSEQVFLFKFQNSYMGYSWLKILILLQWRKNVYLWLASKFYPTIFELRKSFILRAIKKGNNLLILTCIYSA